MFRNHLKTAWRSLLRNKLQTGINIIGLAIGIAGCLSVFHLAKYELAVNDDIVHGDRIYRIYTQFSGQFEGVNAGVPVVLEEYAATNLKGTDVQAMIHTFDLDVQVPQTPGVSTEKIFYSQEDIVAVGASYFDLIQNYEWLSGAPRESLKEPFQVVLTESKAKKYFGFKNATEAIGQELIYDDSLTLIVSGILKDPDFLSDFYFTDFISKSTIQASFLKDGMAWDNWQNTRSGDQFFVKTAEGLTKDILSKNLQVLTERSNADNEEGSMYSTGFKAQALSDLHFNHDLSLFDYGRMPAHKPTLYGLMLVAVLLLLIAAINFINLATVQATRRSKETGVRKVIGASRGQLTWQFLVETALIAFLALPISAALTELAMRHFSEFLPAGLSLNFMSPSVILFLLGSVLLVTFLAGLYPSFILSSFKPAFAIRSQSGNAFSGKSSGLRKSLIVFQFVLAQAFIIGALFMGRQLNYVMKKDLGFNQEAIVNFNMWGTGPDAKLKLFQQRLAQLPGVIGTSHNNRPPIGQGYQTTVFELEKDGEKTRQEVHMRMVDTAYVGLYGLEMLAGRNVHPSDTTREFVINESLAKIMGYDNPVDVLGQTVIYRDDKKPVVGVVKDFHVRSLHHAIPPLALSGTKGGRYALSVKIGEGASFSKTMENIKTAWTDVYPGAEFKYTIFDESIAKLYESESNLSKFINTATGLAILVSCLGLFGLAFFTVTQRAKEISIRKVLGASAASVVGLLTKDFVRLVLLALLIAAPISYYFITEWLKDFAFHIEVEWWVFPLAGMAAVGVAFLTVGFQSLKAALVNPVESLKND